MRLLLILKADQLGLFDMPVHVAGSVDKHGHVRAPHVRIQKVKPKAPPAPVKSEIKVEPEIDLFSQVHEAEPEAVEHAPAPASTPVTPPKLDLPTVELDGDTWYILNTGAKREDGKVYAHLSSATRGRQAKNGVQPIQINDYIDLPPAAEPESYEIVEHQTKRRLLRGAIRRDLTESQARDIDPYTFRKDGGWFIREKHLSAATPAKPSEPEAVAAKEAPGIPMARLEHAAGIDYSGPFNSIAVPSFGVVPGTSKAERKRLNAAAVELVRNALQFTDADRAVLAQYSGNGGVGDSLNEYYTLPEVAAAMWKTLRTLGVEGGNVLEPSCATGVFMATAPASVRVTGVELDETSAKIANVLHGASHEIRNSSLERFATSDERQFDAVVGNAPFGLRGAMIKDDKPELKTAEQYFLDTSLDKTKPGGIVAMIVPTGVMDSKNGRSFRERLLRKAEFLGAQRMPNTAFEAAHTAVTTDIVYFRKRPDDVAGALSTVDMDTLRELGVWDDEFLAGAYFGGRGAGNVFGTMEEGWRAKAGIGDDITVNGSMVGVPESIAEFTATEEQSQPTMENILAALTDDNARARALGAAATKPYAAAKVGDTKTVDGITYVLHGDPPRWHRVDEVVDTAMVSRATELAQEIERLMAGEAADRKQLEADIREFIEAHGIPVKNKDLLLAAKSDPTLHRLIGAVAPNGRLSDVVTGKEHKTESTFDATAQVLSLESKSRDFTVAELAARLGREEDEVADHLAADARYAYVGEGRWAPMDDYLTGELWPKLDALKAEKADPSLAEKFATQERLLLEAIDPKSLEDVEIALNSAFIPTDVVAAYFNWKNYESPEASKWTKDLAPVEITFDKGVYSIKGGSQYGDIRLLDKYLNRTGVRKDDMPAIERMNEQFKEWLCGSRFRDQIEDLYNRSFRGFKPVAFSDAPIDIPGLANHDRIKDYQWPGLRWALAAGKGIIAADVGLGKAQPLDAKILTPSGWKRMGDIAVGDQVISVDGTPTTVTGVFPQGEKEIFRVAFQDGSSTECCDEHLWLTQTHLERNNARRQVSDLGVPKVRSLSEIRETLTYRGMKNHAIPMVMPVRFDEQPVPLNPYLLGALLGDGSIIGKTPSLTSMDMDIVIESGLGMPDGHMLSEYAAAGKATTYNLRRYNKSYGRNEVSAALRDLGLECDSFGKFVPDTYKFNSVDVRLAVLRGLMDTDGFVDKSGLTVQFTSCSKRLAEDVQFLAQSLGGNATIKTKVPGYTHKGEKRTGALSYIVHLRMPASINPFYCARKAARVRPKEKYVPVRYITGIEPVGRKQAQCISVDHPSHLYVTDDFIVTHNTLRGMLLARMAKMEGRAQKPMIVVPKSVLAKWAAEAEMWFPGSKIMVLGATLSRNADGELMGKDDGPAERARKLHDLTQNEYDFIICAESVYQEVDLSPELKERYAGDEFWAQRGDKMGNMGDKRRRKVREAFEQKIAGREFDKRTDAIYFDNLGVDMIIRDEGHREKNLWSARNRFGETPKFLGGQGESNRAYDFYLKSKYIRDKNNGNNVYMLTATPTKNSPLEVYSMLSHIAPEAFERIGIRNSEEFLDRFCEFENDRIYTLEGTFEDALVVSGFKNLGELREIMSRYIDRKTAEDVGLELPTRDDRMHYLDMDVEQRAAYLDLRQRLLDSKNSDEATGDAHIFAIMSDMAKAAMDLELYDKKGHAGYRSPKYEAVAKEAFAGSKDGGQIIFAEYIDAHEKIADALVRQGVPRSEIAIVNAKVAGSAVKRQNISDKFNAGKIKYVIGNATMSEGMDLQKLTSDIHHLDLPWEPASLQQRNGRGLRQGNTNDAVRIHTYISKGTFDGYRYQSLTRKKDWQDLLWKGGDRVENLLREGRVSHDDLAIMCADDPEAAAKAHAENKELANQRYEAEQRAALTAEFERYQSLKSSYRELKNKESISAQRLKARIEAARDRLKSNQLFKAKSALDATGPVLIHPQTGDMLTAGQGFEVPKDVLDTPGQYVVTSVDPKTRYVSVRRYGVPGASTRTVKLTDFAKAKPFAYDAAAETKEIERVLAEQAQANVESVVHPAALRGMPAEMMARNYDVIQGKLKTALKEYKWRAPEGGYSSGPVGFVGQDGKATFKESYNAREGADTMDVLLPTAEHREKALLAWADAEASKQFRNETQSHGRRSSKTTTVLKQKYADEKGSYYGQHTTNPWTGIGKEVFGPEFEKEARDRFYADRLEAARRASNFGDALRALAPTIQLDWGGAKWPKRAIAILWARAKRDGILDRELSEVLKEVKHQGEHSWDSRQVVPPALFKGPDDYPPDTTLHTKLALLAAKENHSDLAAAMLTSGVKDQKSGIKAIKMLGKLKGDSKWAAIHHLVEKHGLGALKTNEIGGYDNPFFGHDAPTLGEAAREQFEKYAA